MSIVILGHNHSTAPVELRERFTFGEEGIRDALNELAQSKELEECAIISTCNRNEIYSVGRDFDRSVALLRTFFYRYHGIEEGAVDSTLYIYRDEAAVEHLFAVVSGIDSMIVGETQIFSQVKEAFQQASRAGTTGPVLNRLFQRCFETGKRVRHRTRISQGAVSVSYAAAELAKKIFGRLEDKTVILVGAGETGELTARNLAKSGVTSFIVVNRTYERAVELAGKLGGRPLDFGRLDQSAEEADIMITSTSSPGYVLSGSHLSDIMRRRKNSPLFIIDLAVPRDIDPEARRIYNVFLYDMDDLAAVAEENRRRRKKEIEKASTIIGPSVESFMGWYRSLDTKPTIISLREHFEEIRMQQMKKYSRKLEPEAARLLDEATRTLINKLLHHPSVEIRRAHENGEGRVLTKYVRKIFRLDDE